MSVITGYTPCSSKFPSSSAINMLESSLLLSLSNLKELVLEFEQLYMSAENYKTQYKEHKDKCESNKCKSSEALREVIAAKDQVIQLAASSLTKLDETKNLNIVKEIFKILCSDTTPHTPQKTKLEIKEKTGVATKPKFEVKKEPESPVYSPENDYLADLVKENDVGEREKEESLLEIEGTPTGRTSPIIQPKKLRSTTNNNTIEFREKKKCPDTWASSETKAIKLLYSITPTKGTKSRENLRLKQSKLHLVKVKQSNSIDLTTSPEFSGGVRVARSEKMVGVQPLIKKESIENEDTILPSPTSGPTSFSALYKSSAKNSPTKFKTPLSLTRLKSENVNNDIKTESPGISDVTNIEESIKLLQPNRRNGLKRQSPVKSPFIDKDITECETQKDDSISLLQHVKILESNQENVGRKTPPPSPNKRPLMENKNLVNVTEDVHIESSLSLLSRDIKVSEDKARRKVPDAAEDIYKEPTVRKKAEKRALPGWSCDECREFFDEMYKDNPEMLAKKMDECSKHRGRKNPARPKTPENFWNPRWEVPEDTEEFNRRNNVK